MLKGVKDNMFFVDYRNKFDLFAFLPVPKTYPVSTKLSVVGSLLFFFMIFVYIIVNFVDFLSHNVPKVYFIKFKDRVIEWSNKL